DFLSQIDFTISNLYFVSSLHDLDAACPHAYAAEQRLDDYLYGEMELAGHAYSSIIPISNFSLTVYADAADDGRKFKQFLRRLHKKLSSTELGKMLGEKNNSSNVCRKEIELRQGLIRYDLRSNKFLIRVNLLSLAF